MQILQIPLLSVLIVIMTFFYAHPMQKRFKKKSSDGKYKFIQDTNIIPEKIPSFSGYHALWNIKTLNNKKDRNNLKAFDIFFRFYYRTYLNNLEIQELLEICEDAELKNVIIAPSLDSSNPMTCPDLYSLEPTFQPEEYKNNHQNLSLIAQKFEHGEDIFFIINYMNTNSNDSDSEFNYNTEEEPHWITIAAKKKPHQPIKIKIFDSFQKETVVIFEEVPVLRGRLLQSQRNIYYQEREAFLCAFPDIEKKFIKFLESFINQYKMKPKIKKTRNQKKL